MAAKFEHLLGAYGLNLSKGGNTCCDTGPRFLRSQSKDSLDPHVHRPLALYLVFFVIKNIYTIHQ